MKTASEWVGRTVEDPPADVVCERGHVLAWLEATRNANPLYWDADVASEVTGGWIAPSSMLSAWMRPLTWRPDRDEPHMPLSLHFELKDAFELPDGVVASTGMTLHAPVRPGDRVRTAQTVREISEPTERRLGTGRFWTIDVTYRNSEDELLGVEWYRMFSYRGGEGGERPELPRARGGSVQGFYDRPDVVQPPAVLPGEFATGAELPSLEVAVTARTIIQGAVASRDWQPQHHDHHWARERAGTRDVFLNTPTQAGWIERYLTDQTGPLGRLGSMSFRMRRSICDGDVMLFRGVVTGSTTDGQGCRWADVEVTISVAGEVATRCQARIAIPVGADDNPWRRRGDDWRP